MLPARAATPPSARGEISAAAGDGGEIIRARTGERKSSGPEPPICCRQSRYAAIPRGKSSPAGDGGTIIRARAATLPSGRGCMRYRRRSFPRGPGMLAL